MTNKLLVSFFTSTLNSSSELDTSIQIGRQRPLFLSACLTYNLNSPGTSTLTPWDHSLGWAGGHLQVIGKLKYEQDCDLSLNLNVKRLKELGFHLEQRKVVEGTGTQFWHLSAGLRGLMMWIETSTCVLQLEKIEWGLCVPTEPLRS